MSFPATGPVYINGAKPGDVIKISIEKLQLGPVGILDIGTNPGSLKPFFDTVFLTEYHGHSDVDAGMLIDMVGDLIICQIVNPMKTVRMEIPKWTIEKLK